ncbi:MAG: 50S ribosomal protein L4 [Candidatus Aureabacteria bacterium]|nr:50S ribosomal protein L4 [Candidatus Auribacterota bacterium]
MAKVKMLNISGKKVGDYEVPEKILELEPNEQAIHDAVVARLAVRRSGTASTKTRSEVNKSHQKMYRQKGTGKARAGTAGSPIRVGGGVAFGPKPRKYSMKISKKAKCCALKSAIVQKFKSDDVVIVDELKIPGHKTSEVIKFLQRIKAGNSSLIVLTKIGDEVKLAVRNLSRVNVSMPAGLNTYDVLYYKKLVVGEDALKEIIAMF